MRYYKFLKPCYVERQKRAMDVGEIIDFNPEDGAILESRGIVVEVGEQEVKRRKTKHKRVRDPELDKLDNLEV